MRYFSIANIYCQSWTFMMGEMLLFPVFRIKCFLLLAEGACSLLVTHGGFKLGVLWKQSAWSITVSLLGIQADC